MLFQVLLEKLLCAGRGAVLHTRLTYAPTPVIKRKGDICTMASMNMAYFAISFFFKPCRVTRAGEMGCNKAGIPILGKRATPTRQCLTCQTSVGASGRRVGCKWQRLTIKPKYVLYIPFTIALPNLGMSCMLRLYRESPGAPLNSACHVFGVPRLSTEQEIPGILVTTNSRRKEKKISTRIPCFIITEPTSYQSPGLCGSRSSVSADHSTASSGGICVDEQVQTT
jgi:hypothetical protein